MRNLLSLRSTLILISALALGSTASAQAVFTPIPSPFQPAIMPFDGSCYASGGSGGWSTVRVSADGNTVASVVYSPLLVPGAAPRSAVVWTEAGGTQVIAQDLFAISSEYFVPTGISADGNTVFGDQWMWNRATGVQSLSQTLRSLATNAGYFFGSQILIFSSSQNGSVVTGIVEDPINNRKDYFLWQVGSPQLQILPTNAQFGPDYYRFHAISGNGLVVGGSVQRPAPQFGSRYAAVLVTGAGSTAISTQSSGCNFTGVWDLNFDGSVAVGTQETSACNMAAFRWTPSGGLAVFGPSGSAAYACDATGDVVVGDYINFGVAGTKPFLWTPTLGFRDLQSELVARWNLGGALQGWTLLSATDVSADGRVIVGTARNPAGCEQAFVVRFPANPASVVSYGVACVSAQGTMQLQSIRPPYVGNVAETRCAGASPTALQIGVLGFGPVSVPFNAILPQGAPGCDLLVVPDQDRWLSVANGSATWLLPIPAQQALLGVTYWQQVVRLDASANGLLQSVRGSNGLQSTIGRY